MTKWLRVVLLLSALITYSVALFAADTVPFPPAPTTAAEAATAASFDARAEKIIEFNACGREADYSSFRAAPTKAGNEDLTNLLIAKLAWIRTHSGNDTCNGLSGADMVRQVNESIRAMKKTGQMGTNDLKCIESLQFGADGDWDVNVRELVRILYLARTPSVSLKRECGRPSPAFQAGVSLLDPATIDYMYEQLLTARGGRRQTLIRS